MSFHAFDKAKLLSKKRNDPSFKFAQESFVRVLNLANKSDAEEINVQLFQTPSEEALYQKVNEVKNELTVLQPQFDAEQTLSKLETLAEPIHQFFEHNMVMDPNEAIKENRLALINQIADMINDFGNLTLIEWKQHH